MNKCKCFSADIGYHRDDCSIYDTHGKLKSRSLDKIISFEEIQKLNPSRNNPIKLESSKLTKEYQNLRDSGLEVNSFTLLYHKITVIGTNDKDSEIIILDRFGRECYFYYNEYSFLYDIIN